MGNTFTKSYFEYNKFEFEDKHFGPNYTGPFIHPSVKDFKTEVEDKYKNISTIKSVLDKMKMFKDKDCLGYRKWLSDKNEFEKKYTFYKYSECIDMAYTCSKNLHEKVNELCVYDTYDNIDLKLIGIFAKNCVEWVLSDLACQLDSITTVTLYATLGIESFKFICDQTMISTIFISPDIVDMFCDFYTKLKIERIKTLIFFDLTVNATEEQFKKLRDLGLKVYSFKNDFLKENKNVKNEDLTMATPDSVLTICYTSGTTGKPKGALVLQRNIIAVLNGSADATDIPLIHDETNNHYSYLPLAHVFERFNIVGFLTNAGRIGFISGTVKNSLQQDLKLIEPCMLVAVPKVIQTLRSGIFDQVHRMPKPLQLIFYKALEIKKQNYNKYGILTHPLIDKVVFSKITQNFGRNMKHILCASAPLPKDIATEIKLLLSVPIVEGWGCTELGGSGFASTYLEYYNHTQGGVVSTMRCKLVDVPDLSYTKDSKTNGLPTPSGEICIQGPGVFKGYYKNPEETKKSLDDEGYFHSGDIGSLMPHYGNGIKIVDRLKEIFKLSQGEYIVPNKLEAIYLKSKYVEQMMIYGNSYKNHIIAIIMPKWKACAEFLGLGKNADKHEMVNDPRLYEEIKKDFLELATDANFNSLEKLYYFILSPEDFSIENGCLNPTMKVVRKKVEAYFKKDIDALYDKIEKKKK